MLSVAQYLLGNVISVDVDADRANDSKFFSFDWDRRAFEFSRTDVQLVIQFVFIQELAAFEINQQVCCAITQVPPSNIVFERNKGVRGISQVVQQYLDSGIRKRFPDQAHNSLVVF